MAKATEQKAEVAQTIIEQLGGQGKLIAMIGANGLGTNGNDLVFKFKCSRVANYVKIKLNSLDLYDIEFGKIKKFNYDIVETFEGVYADMLVDIFESTCKVNLSL